METAQRELIAALQVQRYRARERGDTAEVDRLTREIEEEREAERAGPQRAWERRRKGY